MNASDSNSHFITRRDFMKKSALTVGAISLLSQGMGLAAGGSEASSSETPEPYLRCVSAPTVPLNLTFNQSVSADKYYNEFDGTGWHLYGNNTHGTNISAMLLGVSEGWVGQSCKCIINARSETIGDHPIGTTEFVTAYNIVQIRRTPGGGAEVEFTHAEDADNDDIGDFYNWANIYVSIHSGSVMSIYSEWHEHRDTIQGTLYEWRTVANNVDTTGLSWEFEIIWI